MIQRQGPLRRALQVLGAKRRALKGRTEVFFEPGEVAERFGERKT